MPTLNKSYDFSSDTWTKVSGGDLTPVHSASGGNTGGCYSFAVSGRNSVGTGYIELSTTWESLGVPSGATINEIDSSSFDWICDVWSADSDSYTIGSLSIHDNSGTLQATLISSQAGSGSTSYAAKNGSVVSIPASIQNSNSNIKIRLYVTCDNGNAKTVDTGVKVDNLAFTIDYSSAAIQIVGSDLSQLHSLSTGAIAQSHLIVASDLLQSQSSVDGVITQAHNISGENLTHSQSADTGEISQTTEINISGEDLSHSQSLSDSIISQTHEIIADNLNQSQSVSVGAISQTHDINAEDLNQSQSVSDNSIVQIHVIIGEYLNHSQAVDNGILGAEITINGNNLSQSQTVGIGNLSQSHEVVGEDLTQSQESSGGQIQQAHEVFGIDINQSQSVSVGVFYQVHYIAGNNSIHTHTLTNGVFPLVFRYPDRNYIEIESKLNRSRIFSIFVTRENEYNVTLSRDKP